MPSHDRCSAKGLSLHQATATPSEFNTLKFLSSQISYLLGRSQTRRNLLAFGKFLLFLLGVMALFSVAFHAIMTYEGQDYSWITGLYWTLTVMSTLGFGDITFQSDLGRGFSIVVLISGIVLLLIVLPFSFIRSFYAPWLEAQLRTQAPRSVPATVSGHVILCSWDEVTIGIAERLRSVRIPYYVIETDPMRATDLHVEGVSVICGQLDAAATYRAAGVERARLVFASLDDATNTSIILTAHEACPDVKVIALAEHKDSIDLLEMAGAAHVLALKQRLGEQLANRVESSRYSASVIGSIEDLHIAEFPVYRTPLAGKTLLESKLRQTTGVNVVGVWERGKLRPVRPNTVLEDWIIPVVVGTSEQIDAVNEIIFSSVPASDTQHPVLVVGAGKVGRATANRLLAKGVPVHYIEHDKNIAARSDLDQSRVFVGESADRDLLTRAGVEHATSVVLTTNDDSTNIYLSIYFRKINPDLIIVARITHDRNIESIHRAGADFALSYASLAQESVLAIVQQRDFIFLGGEVEFTMLEVPSSLEGVSLRESGIGAKTGLNVIAVRQGGLLRTPTADTQLQRGSMLLAIGTPKQQSEFAKAFEDK